MYSGHRGYGFFGPPPDTATAALLVGEVRGAADFCRTITPLPAHVDPAANGVVNGVVPLALCTPAGALVGAVAVDHGHAL